MSYRTLRQLIALRNAGLALTMLGAVACNSVSASRHSASSQPTVETASGDSGDGPLDVMCMGERINSPQESFHYSYKFTNASGSLDNEAEITAQSIDIVRKDSLGSHSFHGVRSNELSWNSAVLDLSGLRITGLSARLQSLNHTSSLSSKGPESVNGYSTGKYVIDTASANSSDKGTYEALFGKGSLEKGTAWMGPDACVVKLVLDESIVKPDGSVDKGHYEMERSKK